MRPSIGHRSITHGFSMVKINAVVRIGEWISVEGVIKDSIIAVEGVKIYEAFFLNIVHIIAYCILIMILLKKLLSLFTSEKCRLKRNDSVLYFMRPQHTASSTSHRHMEKQVLSLHTSTMSVSCSQNLNISFISAT